MAKIGIIAPVPTEVDRETIGGSLAAKGFNRYPGTKSTITPYKEYDGTYRTGLDPDAMYLKNLPDQEREIEIKRIKEAKARLEKATGIKLDPDSPFYNISSKDIKTVERVVLTETGAAFNFSDPFQEIQYHFVRVHPTIASSLEAIRTGRAFAGAQYYVQDAETEVRLEYNHRKELNKAIAAYEAETPTRQRQICRLMNIPVDINSSDEELYNQIDKVLRAPKMTDGKHKGLNPVKVFNSIIAITPETASTMDLVYQALQHGVWYEKAGDIYEGENKISDSVDDLVARLLNKAHQDELLALKQKLRLKQSV